jgi:plastocyanin domain-containing protein
MTPFFVLTIAASLLFVTGCDSKPAEPAGDSPAAATPVAAAAARTIAVTVDDKGFHPSTVPVTKGEKITLRFKRTSEDTCATDVVFPELDIKKPLPLNKAVDISVPTSKARTLAFQCGMGMYKSSVVIK